MNERSYVCTMRLKEVVDVIRGISFPTNAKSTEPFEGSIACLRTANVQREVEWSNLWHVSRKYVKQPSQLVGVGDILISNANSYELVGKVALVNYLQEPATLGAFIAALRPKEEHEPRFLYYQLASPRVQKAIRSCASTTTNISNVSTAKLGEIVLTVPPRQEQEEIADSLDEQFSRLDEGIAALKRAQANLKRYRASVLKAACEGRLVPTEAELARKEGRDYETGEQLLARILDQRRRYWSGRGKYKEPHTPDMATLPSLPRGWVWASTEQLAYVDVGFAFKSTEFEKSGVRMLRGDNIEPGRLRWTDTKFWPETKVEPFKHLLIQKGEIVLAMDRPVVSAGLKIARASSFDLPCLLVQRMARFKPVLDSLADHMYISLNTGRFIEHVLGGQTGTQLPHISRGDIDSYAIPLPPHREQERIVTEVDRLLSLAEQMRAGISGNLHRASRLKKSILQRAFSPEYTDAVSC